MTESPTPFAYLGKYALILVGGIAALMVANAVMLGTIGVPVPSGAATIIPPMIAALVVGQTWGKDAGALPDSRAAWRFAAMAAGVFLAVQLPLTLFGLSAVGPAGQGVFTFAAILLLVTTAIVLLANRWFVSVGAKGAIKQR
ncbi:ABZJ_00895 family protein [Jannaschia donghaensis]|uniref:Uncharacterized protein n=1 Tax=Jannaschia donghaensis TaxID=420998 RepID=A0A0M6YM56_9RHOB|nr:ABZJ_00895 family protein [Jannaschia donghaensis]CTQ50984.1 hypothetical protein JDO7802_03015 [Jannaschia donghaensis]